MAIEHCHLLFFSPCGGTAAVARALGAHLDIPVTETDLTLPHSRTARHQYGPSDLVVMAFPVYGGRLPRLAVNACFAALSADHTPTLLVAVYGNRDYEDALLEMAHWATECGFVPIAAAAAIAEHTMVAEVAADRPDAVDRKVLGSFGKRVLTLVSGAADPTAVPLRPPGVFPFRKPPAHIPFGPKTSDACTLCGTCVSRCPMAAIPEDDPQATRMDRCITCQACIKFCPEGARCMDQPEIEKVRDWLRDTCLPVRREVEVFLSNGISERGRD